MPILLRGHEDRVTSATYSADGKRVVTASRDGTARIWTVSLELLRKIACASAGRNLTREEWSSFLPRPNYDKTCDEWPEAPLPPRDTP